MSAPFTNPAVRLLAVVALLGGCAGVERAPHPADTAAVATAAAGAGSQDHGVPPEEQLRFDELPAERPDVRVKKASQEQFSAAVEALAANDLGRAESLLTNVTRAQPELSGPWLNLGQVYLAQEKLLAAETAFQRAIRSNPANCAAYNQLGVLARQAGRLRDAERSYLACIERNPSFPEVHLNLGILYELYLGELESALAAYRTYQQLAPEPVSGVAGWVMDLERRL